MKKFIAATALLATFGAIAGPMGLNKGMTLEELKKLGSFSSGDTPFVHSSKTLTNGHPDFEVYSVIVTPAHGLCKLVASSKDIESSAYGSELEGRFKELISAMTEKYKAPGKKFDFLRSGSIWKEPRDWMMGLLKRDRTITAYWSSPENLDLPDSISSISIEAIALSPNKGYIRIGYEFDNFDACIATVKSKINSNL